MASSYRVSGKPFSQGMLFGWFFRVISAEDDSFSVLLGQEKRALDLIQSYSEKRVKESKSVSTVEIVHLIVSIERIMISVINCPGTVCFWKKVRQRSLNHVLGMRQY